MMTLEFNVHHKAMITEGISMFWQQDQESVEKDGEKLRGLREKEKERPGIFFLTTVESGGEVEAPWLEGEKEENIN